MVKLHSLGFMDSKDFSPTSNEKIQTRSLNDNEIHIDISCRLCVFFIDLSPLIGHVIKVFKSNIITTNLILKFITYIPKLTTEKKNEERKTNGLFIH